MTVDKDYSHRNLAQKLGIKSTDSVLLVNAPAKYEHLIGGWPPNVSVNAPRTYYSFIHLFVSTEAELEEELQILKSKLAVDGMLWVSNPKGNKDFNQNDVMRMGLTHGLVDVKVASFDEHWSALKFVYRLKDRS